MSKAIAIIALSASFLIASFQAQAGPVWGPPGWPNWPQDPMGHPPPPKPKLCRWVNSHECVDYQGNPPHCRRYQSVRTQVCD